MIFARRKRNRSDHLSLIRDILRPFYKAATVPPYAKNRMRWRLRYILKTPMRWVHRDGEMYDLGDDFVDDQIIRETYGKFYKLFFPEVVRDFPAGGWILDVGAHHGVYSVLALRKYPGSKMIAIEPDPKGAQMLRNNLQINGLLDRVEIVEAAISSADGSGTFVEDSMGSWGNHLVRDDAPAGPATAVAPQTGHAIQVKTLRLETVLRGRAPELVKLNAEGAEFDVIPQMFQLNIRPKWIILLGHEEAGPFDQLLQSIRDQGYQVDPVESEPGRPRYVCVRR